MSSKAHFYESILFFNQGIEQAVHGLGRLRKSAELNADVYRETLARLEKARAQINLQFFEDMAKVEKRDDARHGQENL